MTMQRPALSFALRSLNAVSSIGFFLIISSIIYFIIGSVVSLVHGDMLDWTFCGSLKRLIGVNWCDYEPHMGWAWGNWFLHRLINATLPWVMMVVGLAILAISLPAINALDYKFSKRTNRDI